MAPAEVRGHVIGHHDLLEHPPGGEQQSGGRQRIAEAALPLQLGEQVRGPFDGAGHEEGEIGDEEGVVHDVAVRAYPAVIDVEDVGQPVEGVEGDAHGEDDAQRGDVGMHAHGGQQGREVLGEEPEVLEEPEHGQAEDDAGPQPEPTHAHVGSLLDADGHRVAGEGGEGQQQREPPVPGHVEGIARRQQEGVLAGLCPVEHQPEPQEDGGQEDEEREAVEEHAQVIC